MTMTANPWMGFVFFELGTRVVLDAWPRLSRVANPHTRARASSFQVLGVKLFSERFRSVLLGVQLFLQLSGLCNISHLRCDATCMDETPFLTLTQSFDRSVLEVEPPPAESSASTRTQMTETSSSLPAKTTQKQV